MWLVGLCPCKTQATSHIILSVKINNFLSNLNYIIIFVRKSWQLNKWFLKKSIICRYIIIWKMNLWIRIVLFFMWCDQNHQIKPQYQLIKKFKKLQPTLNIFMRYELYYSLIYIKGYYWYLNLLLTMIY